MKFVRRRISPDAVQPPNTRYDETCDCVQTRASETSPWVDNPAADPRHADSFRLPPRESADPKCDASEAMIQHFKAAVDAFLTSANILLFVNSIVVLVAIFFPAIALFSRGIFLVAEALLTIGTSVVDAAMTEEVYDQIKCILYCNIGEDGQMSAAQLADIQSQIDSEIGGTPNLVFDLFAGLWGEVQWSNAGAVGEYTGDCEDCECCHDLAGCFVWDFQGTGLQLGWSLYANGRWETNPSFYGWWMTCVGGIGSDARSSIIQDFPSDQHAIFTSIEVDIQAVANPVDWEIHRVNSDGSLALLLNGTSGVGDETVGGAVADEDCYGIMVAMQADAGCGFTDCWIKAVRIQSPDLCPLDLEPNC